MPRYHSAEELQTIRKFIEESEAIDATSPAELEELRTLVEKHLPWLLEKLPPYTEH